MFCSCDCPGPRNVYTLPQMVIEILTDEDVESLQEVDNNVPEEAREQVHTRTSMYIPPRYVGVPSGTPSTYKGLLEHAQDSQGRRYARSL